MNKRAKVFDFESAIAKKQITKDGKEWLTLALDPFHDWNVPIAGYPDADCSNTVVQCFQYQADLSAPGAGIWDAHLYVNQAVANTSVKEWLATASGSTGETAVAFGFQTGLVNIIRVMSGQPMAPTGIATYAPLGLSMSTLGTYADLCTANSRIIGMGIEVINTSAEIYKQGSITCYKMPQMASSSYAKLTNSAGTASGTAVVKLTRLPPSYVADASKLHGTVTWEASKGAYCVVTQNSVNNDLSGISYEPNMMTADGSIETGAYQYAAPATYAPVAIPSSVNFSQKFKHFPLNTHGIMVTGLGENSTLRVRVRIYVERAPTTSASDSALVVLATPSAGYDSAALKLYSETAARMPVGVPVDMNAFGDWWKIVSGIAKTIAVPVGALLGGPTGGAIGGVAAAGLSGLDSVFRDRLALKGAGPVPEAFNPGSKGFKIKPLFSGASKKKRTTTKRPKKAKAA
jgi:hypothetical protein